jgi:alpha-beta hydrolase superfamily lysophospholipase
MTPGKTPPPHHHGRLMSRDDHFIVWQSWLPGPLPRAALVFVHGLAEHIGRYGYPIQHFTRLGFACYGLDLRGHGQSDGIRVHVQSFDDYDADVAVVLREVRERHPGLPTVLIGHSMGGLVALRYALNHPDELQALIVSSPALGAHPKARPPRHLVRIAKILSLLWPTLLFKSNLDASMICRDPAIVEAYVKDKLVSNRASARWFTSLLAAQEDAFVRAGNLRTPTLLMQSGADQLVDPAATARWAELAAPELVSFYTWPGFYHEMFNEPERLKVFQLMESWIDNWLSAGRRDR